VTLQKKTEMKRIVLYMAVVFLGGCGPSEPRLYKVSGTVSFDGQPVETGTIVFEPVDSVPGNGAGGEIHNGVFTLQSRQGKKKVSIRATRPIPGKWNNVMKVPAIQQYIPADYNSKTILTAEVLPEGENHFEFNLASDAKTAAKGDSR
jgi:hypothetical protein